MSAARAVSRASLAGCTPVAARGGGRGGALCSGGRDPGSEGAGRRRGSPANLGGEEGEGVSGHLSEVLRAGWKASWCHIGASGLWRRPRTQSRGPLERQSAGGPAVFRGGPPNLSPTPTARAAE